MITNRMHVFSVAIAAISVLTGCGTVYEPPLVGAQKTARFRVGQVNDALQTLPYVLADKCLTDDGFPGKEKQITYFGYIKSPEKRLRESLEMPGAPQNRDYFHETRIPSEKELNFQFYRAQSGGVYGYNVCRVGFSFFPETGADYESLIETRGNTCYVSLTKLVVFNDRVERVPVAKSVIDASTCHKK
jgi:hypothetical protein